MKTLQPRHLVAIASLLLLATSTTTCTESPAVKVSVSLKNSQTYRYTAAGGDEEGASISTQAQHYSMSGIRRDSSTGWTAIYIYQPVTGFVGSDRVVLDFLTNKDGIGPPNRSQVEIRFQIGN